MTDRYEDRFANDDERLSALIDGELDSAEAAELAKRLAAEPALARRLSTLHQADRALREAYGPIVREPVGGELAALLERHGAAVDATADGTDSAANVVPLRRRGGAPRFRIPASIAAGLALAIGVWLGVSLGVRDGLTDTERLLASGALIGTDRELYEVIESMPSGETATLAGNLSATPRLTFRTADGGFCREIALSSESRQMTVVGCRESGGWMPEAVIQFSGITDASGNNGFVPASGPTTELDAFVSALMSGVPLGAAAEREAIAAGWR
ncbi:MAG TPA: hypothetical protein VMR74_16875 [Gammaproteobacteria bacterium]|nr:hypothetical protein [Gammaproteobacteria bacterium]